MKTNPNNPVSDPYDFEPGREMRIDMKDLHATFDDREQCLILRLPVKPFNAGPLADQLIDRGFTQRQTDRLVDDFVNLIDKEMLTAVLADRIRG